jgi:hypothetical protein
MANFFKVELAGELLGQLLLLPHCMMLHRQPSGCVD